ncbi:MAG: DUF445 domain-containing protein, partial [Lachnospiraceae bacterium]
MNLQIIAAPIIGGIIGLITNGLAIHMLFRPHNEVKIGKFRLPFTPGLIPKEKGRIAGAVGKIVGNELLNGETLTKALCSEDMQNAFYQKYEDITVNLKNETKTLEEYLEEKGFRDTVSNAEEDISKKAGVFIADKMIEQNISDTILDVAIQEVSANLNPMVMAFAGGAIDAAKMSISVKMDNLILEKCPEYIGGYIDSSYETWMNKPMSEVMTILEEKFPRLKYQIWIVYETFIEERAGHFIEQINIPKVVEDKINEFDVAELEKMIMEIARKELNALVWLGGFLGMIMGLVN